MDRYDLRGECITALTQQQNKPTRDGSALKFRCPRHNDRNPSAYIGDHAWGCHACGFKESLKTLADHLGIDVPKSTGLTLEDYAERKGFTLDLLQKWGCRTANGKYGEVVEIPFLDAEGKVLRAKHRTQAKTFWAEGTGTYLYGLDKLAHANANLPVILVEGESDCHAAWHHGTLAIGIPGANGWKSYWAALLGDREVYIWQEPGDAAEKLVASVSKDVPNLRVIRAQEVKDLADLHKREGANFKKALMPLMQTALAANTPSSEKATEQAIPFVSITGRTLADLETEKQKPIDAVPTPFPKANSACRDMGGGIGLARGWHITVAGKPGNGKSVISLSFCAEAVKKGENALFVSLEMSQPQLTTRWMAITSGEKIQKLETGASFDVAAHRRAADFLNRMKEEKGSQLFCNSRPISDLKHITDAIRYHREFHNCRFVAVDYLQLARVAGISNQLEGITEVSGAVRRCAQDMGIVTIGLSQFNRETSKDLENSPTPQGLMGGSPLENDSDLIFLLDHTTYKRSSFTSGATQQLLLAKNRHGPMTEIPIEWDYSTLRVSERVQESAVVPLPRGKGEAWEPTEEADTSFDFGGQNAA